jgi:vacuolar protein sorting-associated protein 45
MEVSRVEQELSSKENKSEHFKMVWEILNNASVHQYEKLRLVILYCLRYENDDRIQNMKSHLLKIGSSQQSVNLIQMTLDYAG